MSTARANRVWRLICTGAAAIAVGAGLAVAAMLAANSVTTEVTDDDRRVIADLNVDDQCASTPRFDAQIECIEAIQSAIYDRYPDTSDAFKKGETGHHVADYDRRGYGSCYDRARLIEQTLRHYDIEARRVAIYKRQSTPLGYLVPGIDSHALTEVNTDRGWIAVDSIEPLVAVDDAGIVWDVPDLRQGLADDHVDDQTFGTPIPDDLFDGEFVHAYGVYSRHGYFFQPHLPVPEVNWGRFGF